MEPDVVCALQAHAAASYPEECLGALLRSASGAWVPVPLANAAPERRGGFSLSARDYLALEARAEAEGLELVGFYHSHPDAEAVPSARDAEAAWPGWLTVIVPVTAKGPGPLRAWRLDGVETRSFTEVSLA
ncbi:MAG: M67 family metallopeptidase [Myxococcota bacterium]|jgi:proteasome lid subunit RPN8/RPN11